MKIKTLHLLVMGFFLLLGANLNGQSCSAYFNGPNSATAGSKVSFTDASTGTDSSTTHYYWDFGDSSSIAGIGRANVSHTYSWPGTYAVCLTITDSIRRCNSTYCDTISVSSTKTCKPNFFLSINHTKMTVSLQNRSSNVSGATYIAHWEPGDSTVFSGHAQTVKHTYAKAGNYSIRLVQRTNLCTKSKSENVRFKKCAADMAVLRDSTNACKYNFVNKSRGSNRASYVWYFGNGDSSFQKSPNYSYTKDGWYRIALSQWDSSCYSYMVDTIYVTGCGVNCNYSLSGNLSLGGSSNPSAATVYLIDKTGNNLTAIDTIKTDSSGNFTFRNVCADTFYVKAALDSTDNQYANYLPTYYGNELRWDSASTIILNSSVSRINIQLEKGVNSGGPGFIGGDVTQGANKREGDPIGGVQIMILNSQGEGVAYDISNNLGKFELDQLAFGTYYLMAEIPGIGASGRWFTIDERTPKIENVIIRVNENDVSTGIRIIQPEAYLNLSVYPNPARTHIQIETADPGNIKLMNTLGQVVLEKIVQRNTQVNITNLHKGIYYLKFQTTQGGVGTTSFIKQ